MFFLESADFYTYVEFAEKNGLQILSISNLSEDSSVFYAKYYSI
jgi:hypothetical protein